MEHHAQQESDIQYEAQAEVGCLFYTNGDSPYTKTLTYVVGGRLYQKTYGCEALNSRGLPHDFFHLAFASGFETNIYQNTYSSYYITVLPNKVTVNLTLRFALPYEYNRAVQFEPGVELHPIELSRIDFNADVFLQRINILQQNYSRLYQLALLNYFQMTPCDFLTQQMFPGQSWKNVPIVKFMEVIVQIEKRIMDVVETFRLNGRQHILDEFMFLY
jgi:hypothetical protein